MGKFKMPTLQGFLREKIIYDKKKEPVWVELEKRMKDLDAKGIKPYNDKVGTWLSFLRDLKFNYYCQAKIKTKRLRKAVGPPWYYELSLSQREVLSNLKSVIHQDLLEDLPNRMRRALADLGITLKIPKDTLMEAMNSSIEDPGVFIWNLYKAVYKTSPSELRGKYDMNAMILMSSLVFIDLDECIKRLDELVTMEKPKPPPPKKKPKQNFKPEGTYGDYLQKSYVPLVSNHSSGDEEEPAKLDLEYKLRLRSENSYEKLRNDTGFLEKRRERNKKAAQAVRVCHYTFWEAPTTLRNMDPKKLAYVEKLRMLKLKAKAKYSTPYKNVQFQIGNVAYIGKRPQYVISNVGLLPTGYIPINGGIAFNSGDYITAIHGYWRYPIIKKERCAPACDCLTKWGPTVMDYLKESKCKCGHLYDYYNVGPAKEKYFFPPNRNGPFWLDKAKVYQLDPAEDFIKYTVTDATRSEGNTPEPSIPSITASGVSVKDLLASFLADLSDTPLLIPHLPQASLLNNIQEWVRKRVKGKLTAKDHKKFLLRSQRSWLDLKHMDFRARAYRIPFTPKQLQNMNWSHRYMIQDLFTKLMEDFTTRNRIKQLEQTRLWWPTTKFDVYPSKAFLDVFFTYMPGRMKDTFLINPYSSQNTPKSGAKTCPLRL